MPSLTDLDNNNNDDEHDNDTSINVDYNQHFILTLTSIVHRMVVIKMLTQNIMYSLKESHAL